MRTIVHLSDLHFGRVDPDFTWEATDKAEKLARDAGLREPVGQAVSK